MAGPESISLAEASRLSGVSSSTLKRWAAEQIVPVAGGRWTRAAAAQARVIARMRERCYSLEAVREAARGGRLAFGYAEDLFEVPEGELKVMSKLVKETMEGVVRLRVPLVAEVSYGADWAAAK